MKKCPTCNKTFEDNLKFCQADGTPLVEAVEEPVVDPYKTMVANQIDLPIPPKKEADESSGAADKDEAAIESKSDEPEEDVLEVPEEEVDMMKTMVVTGATSGKIDLDIPEDEPAVEKIEVEEKIKVSSPEPPSPPKFDEPELAQPDLTGTLSAPDVEPVVKVEGAEEAEAVEEVDAPPPSPFTSEGQKDEGPQDGGSSPSAPIPSPFIESMPPGYTPPSTPPFDPSESIVEEEAEAAEVAEVTEVTEAAEAADPPAPSFEEPKEISGGGQDWVPPVASGDGSQNAEIAASTPGEISAASPDGQTNVLAVISLVCGILSMTICCFAGLLMGPAAAIIGFLARGKAAEAGGGGLALGGIITGIVGTLFGLILIALQLLGTFANSF